MRIETERLLITEFDLSMAESVHKNSLDEDTRRFVPDEVFETIEDAKETIEFLMSVYESKDGPLVYPVLLKDGSNIGYVQLVPMEEGYEVGYHIGKEYTNNGYATEALKAFLSEIMPMKELDKVYGICVSENVASKKVLEKSGFQKEYEGMGEYQGERKQIVKYVFGERILKYIKATEENLEQIVMLVQETIKTIYPKYYPKEVVDFFSGLHCKENIFNDIKDGFVGILKNDDEIVGTGCYKDNHITRVYVKPAFQKQGYGSYIMQCLENEIGLCYDNVYLDASLPASHLYEKRGYQTLKHERWNVENGVVLVYEVMEKQLAKCTTQIGS